MSLSPRPKTFGFIKSAEPNKRFGQKVLEQMDNPTTRKEIEPKPLAMMGVARSGTTIFYQMVAEYLAQTKGVIGLQEAFSLNQISFWDNGSSLGVSHFDLPYNADIVPKQIDRKIQE